MSFDGADDLGELAARLEQLEGKGAEDAAKTAAPKLLELGRAQWAAGKGPTGESWPRTKDGRVPLVSLTSQASARAEGAAVVLELPDELRFHQAGDPPRLPQRKVIPNPDEALPSAYEELLEDALEAEVDKAIGGAGRA